MQDRYQLMHKEDIAAVFAIDRDTKAVLSLSIAEKDFMPPRAARSLNDFRSWWDDRAVPKTRHNLRDWLKSHGVKTTSEFLLKNLALSLSDCWWIRPEGSSISWKDINFFENDFGTIGKEKQPAAERPRYTPDASTSGNLPKFWIAENGERFLVKGNEGGTYQQSFNEVFASQIHKAQGFLNHVEYTFADLGDKGTGCRCKAFTDIDNEFISAWDIIGREGFRDGEMSRNGFAELLGKMGLDEAECRKQLDYMALSDFILANTDRHLNNLGIIRDPDSLKVKGLAPLYDTGNSMGFGSVLDMGIFLRTKTRGFNNSFRRSLSTVADKNLINADLLPSPDDVRKFYEDSGMSEKNIMRLGTLFGNRAAILRGLQRGKSYYELTKKYESRGLLD